MKQAYQDGKFRAASLKLIERMNSIIEEYLRDGYVMTVRQLYYQLVARGVIENTERSYKNTTDLVNNARLAGLMDWSAIADRTRDFMRHQRWVSGQQILKASSSSYHQDLWVNQECRVFVIVEKEALAGVLEPICYRMDMPLLPARGYPSSTVLREFVLSDILPALSEEQDIVILHLGDHDPSGIDMTRDLEKRIAMFTEYDVERVTLKRIALSMDQIEELKPPPNPAKSSDSRFAEYADLYGTSSWELDALSPAFINELVATEAGRFVDEDKLLIVEKEIKEIKRKITKLAKDFDKVE